MLTGRDGRGALSHPPHVGERERGRLQRWKSTWQGVDRRNQELEEAREEGVAGGEGLQGLRPQHPL